MIVPPDARARVRKPRRSVRPTIAALEPRIAPAGNILVATAGSTGAPVVREFSPSGVKLRELTVASSGEARGVTVSADGNIHDLFGDISTELATYNSATHAWSDHLIAGMSTVNNGSYGGAAYWNGAVYVTDMTTSGDGNTQGIVQFNLSNFSAQRFATNVDPINLNVGLDGMLYALDGFGDVYVFDPSTMTQQRVVTLPTTVGGSVEDYRAVAADASGNLYVATWSSQVIRFDPSGNVQATLKLSGLGYPTFGLEDIQVASDGTVIVGAWGGTVFETTTALAGLTSAFSVGGTGNVFLTFAGPASSPPPPTPSITINDAAVVEPSSGTAPMTFTVQLSNLYLSPVTVHWSTADGTAVAPTDYTAASGTLTFNPGQTSQTVTVQAVGDTDDQPNETFTVNLTNPTNATIARGTALGTIADNSPAPIPQALTPAAAGVLDDYTGSGTFTAQSSGSNALSVRKFDFSVPAGIPYDERSVIEFNTQTVPTQEVSGGSLQVTVDSTTSGSSTVNVYGFADDGNVTLDDGSRPAVLLGSFAPAGLATYTIPLDLAGLLSLLNQGTTDIGIRLQGIPEDNVQFYGTSSSNAPKLTLQVKPPQLSVSDVTVNEGDPANFTVTLSRPWTSAVSVGYETFAGSTSPYATANVDYVPVSGTLVFAAGQTSKTVTVATFGDPAADSGEHFGLLLTSATSPIGYAKGYGTATIVDVPNPTPGIRVSSAPSVTEGGPGTTTPMTFTVSLSVPSVNTVTVDYTTASSTATSGPDFTPESGTLTFTPGQTSQTVVVPIIGDDIYEGNEQLRLLLSNPTNAVPVITTAFGTILDDDPMPTMSIADTSVVEGNSGTTNAVFTVTLSGPSAFYTSAQYATADGTAQAYADYQRTTGTVSFNPGETTKTFAVPVYGDTFTEGNETFTATLSNPAQATISRATATGTILNDDPTSGTMSFTAASWGYAEDSNGDGTFDALYTGGSSTVIRKVTSSPAVEDRALYEFDVSRVVAGVVSSITFQYNVTGYTSSTGGVNVGGFAGSGTVALADATRAVTPLGSYTPTGLGTGSITFDRATVLAIVGSSNYLGLRFDPAASYVNTDLGTPTFGPSYAPSVTFHSDPASPTIIDDSTPAAGYSETGSWSGLGATDGGYDGGYRYAAAGDGSSTATWQLSQFAAGNYDVFATWVPYANRATDAPYRIYDGSTLLRTVYVDQQVAPSGPSFGGVTFQHIGTFPITSGSLKVVLGNDANNYVIADAVRIAPSTSNVDLNWTGGGITAPAGVGADTDFTISRTYQITGGAAPADFTIAYYASADSVFGNGDDVLLGTETISAAADKTVGAHAGTSPTFQLHSAGTYHIFAQVDGTDAIGETDETNNVAQAPQTVAVTGATLIANGSAGYSETGTWSSLGTNGAGYTGSYRYAQPGPNTATAQWQATGLASGNYEVDVTWVPNSNRAMNARYSIYDGNTLVGNVWVNQQSAPSGVTVNGTAFQRLGTFPVSSGTLKVVLGNDANGYVIADSVRIAPVTAAIDLNWIGTGGGMSGPTSLATGDTFTISRTYTIAGAAATTPFTIGYYASTSSTFNRATATLLGTETISGSGLTVGQHSGTTGALLLDFQVSGTYYLFAYLNFTSAFAESDETNNVAQAPQTVSVTGPSTIENLGMGYSETGTWSGAGTGFAGYGGGYRYDVLNTGYGTATWQAGNLSAGTYNVDVTWVPGPNRATNAPYSIYDGSTLLRTVLVNQQASPSGLTYNGVPFQRLGTFPISSGTLKVVLGNDANFYVIADTVRVSPDASTIDLNWQGIGGGISGPASASTGSSFTISRTYQITGAGVGWPVTIDYYASPTDVFNAFGSNPYNILLGKETLSSSDRTVGQHSGTSPALTIDGAGTYYLFAYIDSTGPFAESDETNNVAQAPQAVTVSGATMVDNGGPGYSETGTWSSDGATTGGYNNGYRYAAAGTGTSTATWQSSGLAAGSYTIAATWVPLSNRATNAPYRIYDGATLLQTVLVNQQTAPSGSVYGGVAFSSLGTFTVSSGTLRVVLGNDANNYVIADAVRIASAGGSAAVASPGASLSAAAVPAGTAPVAVTPNVSAVDLALGEFWSLGAITTTQAKKRK